MQLARRISLARRVLPARLGCDSPRGVCVVLWQHDRCDYAKLERFGVYDSLAQCEEVARGEPELMQRSPGATVIVHKGALWRLTVLPDVFAYECWPDTVDPRGPKTR